MKSSRRKFIRTAASGVFGSFATLSTGNVPVAADSPARPGFIAAPAREIPVLAQADIVVCGGGTAGISAAYCAAKHGAKVILLERWPSLGGMATNALVNIWHTSDRTKQVVYGFVQEAIDRGGRFVQRKPHYPTKPETHEFDSTGMRVVFDRMLQEAGVRVLCNLTAVESIQDSGRLQAVLVDTKTGRQAVCGKIFIDATGDGDVAANAGVPFDYGRASDGGVQGMTMMFRLRGLDAPRITAHRHDAGRVFELMKTMRDDGKFPQFLEMADEIREHVIDLLYGEQPLLERLQRFHVWAKVRKGADGNTRGINLTVASFLLAMSDPKQHAFCKPSIYSAAAKALLKTPGEGNSPIRLIHATEFYKNALTLFQERYHLPFTDLQHVHVAFYLLAKPYEGYPRWDELKSVKNPPEETPMLDLNVHLYGPPGTGKTYATVRRAVEICDGTFSADRSELVKRFDELRKENRVCFVTFHQAYGYEDFIEGLRPVLEDSDASATTDAGKDIRYECRPGVFKQLCDLARIDPAAITGGISVDWEGITIWKMSLGDIHDPEQAAIYDE